MKVDISKEEMLSKVDAYEKRINQLIRDFVSVYKKLAKEFTDYKTISKKELEIAEYILAQREK